MKTSVMKKPKGQSAVGFRLMALEFQIRDWLRPPIKILKEAGVRPAMTLIDFGCGPGGFSIAAAKIVGAEGKVYSVDIHPLAIKSVQRAAQKHRLSFIHPIYGESLDEIPEVSVDVALLYDVLHDFAQADPVLHKLHRLLKPSGILSVGDHHIEEADLISLITGKGMFRMTGCIRKTYQFEKVHKGGSKV